MRYYAKLYYLQWDGENWLAYKDDWPYEMKEIQKAKYLHTIIIRLGLVTDGKFGIEFLGNSLDKMTSGIEYPDGSPDEEMPKENRHRHPYRVGKEKSVCDLIQTTQTPPSLP